MNVESRDRRLDEALEYFDFYLPRVVGREGNRNGLRKIGTTAKYTPLLTDLHALYVSSIRSQI